MTDSIADVMRGFALAFVLGALAFVVAECGNVREVRAQDVQLDLARAVAGEAGLDASPDEAAAIIFVLNRRGMNYSAAVRTCRREWVCKLQPDGSKPDGWPAAWNWERFRPMWLRLYAHAGRIVRGEVRALCEADHFGMRSGVDHDRAIAAGWRLVECGRTRNAFWEVR